MMELKDLMRFGFQRHRTLTMHLVIAATSLLDWSPAVEFVSFSPASKIHCSIFQLCIHAGGYRITLSTTYASRSWDYQFPNNRQIVAKRIQSYPSYKCNWFSKLRYQVPRKRATDVSMSNLKNFCRLGAAQMILITNLSWTAWFHWSILQNHCVMAK